MEIPQSSLTAEDISSYWKLAQSTIQEWDHVRSSTNASEYTAYQERLSSAIHGIESIEDELEAKMRDMENKMGSVDLLKKDLKRHFKMADGKYWNIVKKPSV